MLYGMSDAIFDAAKKETLVDKMKEVKLWKEIFLMQES
jgi:hypothetical protein